MFTPPRLPRSSRRPKLIWDHGYWYDHELSRTRTPSLESLSLSPRQTTKTPTDLFSRVAALNRRAATVSAALAHLTAVVKPLETIKAEKLSQNQLVDMIAEGRYLSQAMEDFGEQLDECWALLTEVVKGRGKREREKEKEKEREIAVEEWDWEFGTRESGRKRVL
ncbi:hypothetical protein EK21DRAFT_94275 [Setomelanomma holmii]|uniref:Uncharacterized protein n=1 Tax=Setomelanomma holmii TaxID=210430 RepID=A0A9P4GZY6_9PLEO|nr:hypothetical protein EK21DRAFT_94275 [Setomelanomma holmii]